MAPATSSLLSLYINSAPMTITAVGGPTPYDNGTAGPFGPNTSIISSNSQLVALVVLALFLASLIFITIFLMARSSSAGRRADLRHAAEIEATVRKVQEEMVANPSAPTVDPPTYVPHQRGATLRPDIVRAIDDRVLALSVLGDSIIIPDTDFVDSEGEPSDSKKNRWSLGDPRRWSASSKKSKRRSGYIGEGSSSAGFNNSGVSPPAYDEGDIGDVDLNNTQEEMSESRFTTQGENED